MKVQRIVMVFLALGVLGMSAAGCRHHRGDHAEKWGNRLVKKAEKKLSLSAEQKGKLEAVKLTLLQSIQENKNKRGAHADEIVGMLRSERLDEKRLNALSDDHQTQWEGTRKKVISQLAEFHSSLDGEQKEKLAGIFEKKLSCWRDKK